MTVAGFPWTGGKAKLAEPLAKIIDFCAAEYNLTAFADLCCGGGKVTCAVNPYPFDLRIMNDIERGVSNLYACLTDPVLTRDLIVLTDSLVQREDRRVLFFDADLKRNDPNVDRLKSAAYTLICIYGSFRANKKEFATAKFDENFIEQKVHLDLDITYNRILKDVKVLNDNCIDLVSKYRGVEGLLVYLDPPYHPEAMSSKDHYEINMTKEDHIKLAELLKGSKMKWILSGWINNDYKEILENTNTVRRYYIGTINVSSGTVEGEEVRTHDEYIWTNMYIPTSLIPKKPVKGIGKSEESTDIEKNAES